MGTGGGGQNSADKIYAISFHTSLNQRGDGSGGREERVPDRDALPPAGGRGVALPVRGYRRADRAVAGERGSGKRERPPPRTCRPDPTKNPRDARRPAALRLCHQGGDRDSGLEVILPPLYPEESRTDHRRGPGKLDHLPADRRRRDVGTADRGTGRGPESRVLLSPPGRGKKLHDAPGATGIPDEKIVGHFHTKEAPILYPEPR